MCCADQGNQVQGEDRALKHTIQRTVPLSPLFLAKHVLASLRTPKIHQLMIALDLEDSSLVVTVKGENGETGVFYMLNIPSGEWAPTRSPELLIYGRIAFQVG